MRVFGAPVRVFDAPVRVVRAEAELLADVGREERNGKRKRPPCTPYKEKGQERRANNLPTQTRARGRAGDEPVPKKRVATFAQALKLVPAAVPGPENLHSEKIMKAL